MTATKKPYAFRLSRQAVKSLSELRSATGMTNTSIVEYALVSLNNGLNKTKMDTNLIRELRVKPQ